MGRIEVITRTERRRKYSPAERDAIMREADAPDVTVREVAKRHDIAESLIYSWRTSRGDRYRPAQRRSPVSRQLCEREGTGPRVADLAGYFMISLAPSTKVYLASKPVSMRLGFDGLAALVRPLFSVEPYCGHVFLFRSKSGTYLKALHWHGSGICLFAKRLERHRFVWPPLVEGGVVLTPAQFALLIEAMDWRRTIAPEAPRTPVQM